MSYSDNPFAAALTRNVVDTVHFIGREYDVQEIEDALFRKNSQQQRANVAIIGLPDIGKYCLIYRMLLARKKELQQGKLFPIEINLATYTESDKHEQFFYDLIYLMQSQLEDEDLPFTVTQRTTIAQLTSKALKEWNENKSFTPLREFFKKMLTAGVQVIFILNNFDHAGFLFKDHVKHIEWLRELTAPDIEVKWIALACKRIREIKELPPSISDDFFNERHLGMFTQEDMDVYFQMVQRSGLVISEEQEKTIHFYCGRHPYLLALLGYHLVEEYAHRPQAIDIDQTFRRVEERFHQSYDRIFNLVLDDSERIQNLWTLLTDANALIEQKDIDRMLGYGLIYANPEYRPGGNEPVYVAFSEHFQQYLSLKLPVDHAERAERLPTEYSSLPWNQTMLPGNLLWARYKVVKQVGTTGHSQVVKAIDTVLHRDVAIKCLYLDPAYGARVIKNYQEILEREAKIVSNLEHTNIGKIYDIRQDPPSLIMQWIEGVSLAHVLEQEPPLSLIGIVQLGCKMADILMYIHTREKKPVIHRDIKPENIIVQPNGEPALIDFDIARSESMVETIFPDDEQGNAALFAGTRHYAAPEQFSDPRNVTDKADIYALGVVLYEAMTGQRPDAVPLQKNIPVALWEILLPTLAKEPADRPDALLLYMQLEEYLHRLRW